MEIAPRPVGPQVAALASRQHGVVAARQLVALGLAQQTIAYWAATGRLHRVHRGVYAVGHSVLAVRGHWTAAVLAAGPGAALSHASAAAFWDLRRSAATIVDVTVPGRAGRMRRPGLRIHRPRTGPVEVTKRDAIRVTTPARTLLDLAATLTRTQLERALDRTEILQLTDYPALDAMARAHPSHRGSARLRAAVAEYLAGTMTRSDLEDLFLALCEAAGLPAPLVNQPLAGKEVDFLFAEQRLIVEMDSWRYHRTRRAFDADRARDARHLTLGYRTLRFTDRQLERDRHAVAATLRAALAGPKAA